MPTPKICLIRSLLLVLVPIGIVLAVITFFSPFFAMVAYGGIVIFLSVGYQYIGNKIYAKPKKNRNDAVIRINQE